MSDDMIEQNGKWPDGDRCTTGFELAASEFHKALPGWWYTVGECEVSCHASCAPTKLSSDLALIALNPQFDSGFHADLDQPATLAEALRDVMKQAADAKQVALEKNYYFWLGRNTYGIETNILNAHNINQHIIDIAQDETRNCLRRLYNPQNPPPGQSAS